MNHLFEICSECDCKPGFNRIGAECFDVDECKGNPCPYMNEICHNTDGSFYCDCEIGYQEKGSEGLSGRKPSSNFELRIPDQPAESSTVSGLVKLSELFCEDKNECLGKVLSSGHQEISI